MTSTNPKIECWKCGGPGHIGRNCHAQLQTGKLTRQLVEKVDELDAMTEHVRLLMEQADDLPEDGDEDRDMFLQLMSEHHEFFVDSDE
jgi:DnaJ-class molecular chaperone